jgi:hypothetical protein
MGMHHLQTEVFRVDFSRHLPSLLAIHLVPTHCLRAPGFFRFRICDCFGWSFLSFMLPLSSLMNSTWPGPRSETYTISPSGSGHFLCKDNARPIQVIANTGAMLIVGQERSRISKPP